MAMKSVVRPNVNPQGRQSLSSAETIPDPVHAMVNYTRDYIRENPETAALWCLGIGFVLGWKLKPW